MQAIGWTLIILMTTIPVGGDGLYIGPRAPRAASVTSVPFRNLTACETAAKWAVAQSGPGVYVHAKCFPNS